jgi:hypothetical protein
MIIEAETIFKTHLTVHEEYQGQSTGKFALQLALTPDQKEKLESDGVKVKEYDGQPLRKFASRYEVKMFDKEGAEISRELPAGSKVRLEYITKSHPTAGEVPYVQRLMVLELGEDRVSESDKEFFA